MEFSYRWNLLGSECPQLLLLLVERVYHFDRHSSGSHSDLSVLEIADAILDKIGSLYHDGIDASIGHCHNCEGDLFAPVHRAR